jgi:16S rRNA (guanine1207-N2)-methyltransferase
MGNMPTNTDVYFHKTIDLHFWKQNIQFRTSQQLFSSHDIDAGSKFLLRTIVEADYFKFDRILDVGCGYGPLGLTLKSLHPDSLVQMFDKDALAMEYTKQNTELNGLNGVEIYGSLGYDAVMRNDFDLIISNIPDHAGEAVITYLLREARYYLVTGGIVAVVVVTPLEELVTKILAATPGAQVFLTRQQARHTVFHYRFSDAATPPPPSQSALERGVYRRSYMTFDLGNLEYKVETAGGLPEFDTLSYSTMMLVDALKETGGKDINHAAVINPGQGHVAVTVWQYLKPKYITLVDRDLLALRYSQRNLALNGYKPESVSLLHQVDAAMNPTAKIDLFTGVLREEEGREASFQTLDGMTRALSPKGIIIVSSGSTAITRLVDYVESKGLLRIKVRGRRRGYSLLALEKI